MLESLFNRHTRLSEALAASFAAVSLSLSFAVPYVAVGAAGSLLFVTTDAAALQKPSKSELDSRIKFVDYRPDDVVPIQACEGMITAITFAPGETVVNYGSGFSTAWEFATRDNHFYLKPKMRQGTTNLIVVTDKRTYVFDVRFGLNAKKTDYLMVFRYPEEEKAAAAAKAEQEHKKEFLSQSPIDTSVQSPKEKYDKKKASQLTAAAAGKNTTAASDISVSDKDKTSASGESGLMTDATGGIDPALQPAAGYNWAYRMNFGKSPASRDMAPTAVYDDGRFTVIRLPKGAEIPAVYQVLPEDGEQIVKSHVDTKTHSIVVEKVCRELRLRNGQAVVGIYNENWGVLIKDTPAGTTVPGLKRSWTKEAED